MRFNSAKVRFVDMKGQPEALKKPPDRRPEISHVISAQNLFKQFEIQGREATRRPDQFLEPAREVWLAKPLHQRCSPGPCCGASGPGVRPSACRSICPGQIAEPWGGQGIAGSLPPARGACAACPHSACTDPRWNGPPRGVPMRCGARRRPPAESQPRPGTTRGGIGWPTSLVEQPRKSHAQPTSAARTGGGT